MLKALDQQESARTGLSQELLKELTALNDLWREEYMAIQDELNKVNRCHSSLEIQSEFKGDKPTFQSFMKDIFKGSRMRENTFSALAGNFSDFSAMYRDFDKAKHTVENSVAVFEQYFTDNLTALLICRCPTALSSNIVARN